MKFNIITENMSNHEISNAILRKKALVSNKQSKGEDCKKEEIDLCYLQRELQKRLYNKRSLLPKDLQNFL